MKVGVFSGSFNPVHIGHLALANYFCEFAELDEVWFVVTPCNPLKEESNLMDDNFRLKLVQKAIEGYPKFRVSDVEFSLPRPCYTVHTLDKLKSLHPEHSFVLIIGSDNWELFPRWHQAERLLAENELFIYPRPGYPLDVAKLPPHVQAVSAPIFDVSSTFIREALAHGKDVRYFLHPAVYEELQNAYMVSSSSATSE